LGGFAGVQSILALPSDLKLPHLGQVVYLPLTISLQDWQL